MGSAMKETRLNIRHSRSVLAKGRISIRGLLESTTILAITTFGEPHAPT
jgi:hypothetical protein